MNFTTDMDLKVRSKDRFMQKLKELEENPRHISMAQIDPEDDESDASSDLSSLEILSPVELQSDTMQMESMDSISLSMGPSNNASSSPSKQASPSPSKQASPSPSKQTSPSPSNMSSPSPSNMSSPSPSNILSPSPSNTSSPSPLNMSSPLQLMNQDSVNSTPCPSPKSLNNVRDTTEPKRGRADGFRAILEAEKLAAKGLKKNVLFEDEAEEEEEEEHVKGLGDFGFVINKSPSKEADEDGIDETIREEDLEHIVDTYSDDEGDDIAQEVYRKRAAVKQDREELNAVLKQVREGFSSKRSGRLSGKLDRLLHQEIKKNPDFNFDDLDEQQLATILLEEQKLRYSKKSSTTNNVSEDENSDLNKDSKTHSSENCNKEDCEKIGEENFLRQWKRRALLRKIKPIQLSLTPELDEASREILGLMKFTNVPTKRKAEDSWEASYSFKGINERAKKNKPKILRMK